MIPDTLSCESCRASLRHVVRLGGTTRSEGLVCVGSRVAATVERFYVSACRAHEVLVYDHDGRLQSRFGRTGDGPGEFRGDFKLRGMPDGGVAVFSGGNRVSLYDSDLNLVRTFHTSRRPRDIAALNDGTLALAYNEPTADRFGIPIHLWAEGQLLRSIGEDAAALIDPSKADLVARGISKDRTGEKLWVSRVNEYRIDLFDSRGRLLQSVRREGWFVPWENPENRIEAPQLKDVYEDDDGILWASLYASGVAPRTEDNEYGLVHLIEAIDPQAGQLVASLEVSFAQYPPTFADGFVWQVAGVGREFDEFIDVYRLVLSR